MVDYTVLIREFEGFRENAYPDPLTGGEPITIGYGTTKYSNGRKVKLGDKLPIKEAEKELNAYVERRIIPKLEEKIPTWGKMNSNQKAAIISFAYNLGENFYGKRGFKTITEALSSTGHFEQVPEVLKLYRNPGSSVEKGLLRRRIAEGKLWSKPLSSDSLIDFLNVTKYYAGLAHQQEALKWLTKKYTFNDREKIARIWNPGEDVVYSFDTYARWFSGTDNQIKACQEITKLSEGYAETFYKIWRDEGNKARKIVEYMKSKGYEVSEGENEVNIIHIESRDFIPDTFNDTRMVIKYIDGVPKIVGSWDCTTTPGIKYTKNPLNSKGAAIIKPGQYRAHQVGYHKTPSHVALIQTGGPITVYRDYNRDFKRLGDKEDTGYFGINYHSTHAGFTGDKVGPYSAGCCTARDWGGHIQFMNIVKSDPRYLANKRYRFLSTLILEEDL